MADASTPGHDPLIPLIQGYGGLVWAAPDFQKEHSCFVLVPQYSYITVDNKWQTMPEVDQTVQLLENVVASYPVDENRIYTTGQSHGLYDVFIFQYQISRSFCRISLHKRTRGCGQNERFQE